MQPLPLFVSDQVRAIDSRALEALGLSAYELMGRAGAAAWAMVQKRWPEARRLVVACGPGNNGGDGFVLARLARAAGREVLLVIPADSPPASEDCKRAANDFRATGGTTNPFDGLLPVADLYVDALFGIGLSRPIAGAAQAMVERIGASRKPVLALDVP